MASDKGKISEHESKTFMETDETKEAAMVLTRPPVRLRWA